MCVHSAYVCNISVADFYRDYGCEQRKQRAITLRQPRASCMKHDIMHFVTIRDVIK